MSGAGIKSRTRSRIESQNWGQNRTLDRIKGENVAGIEIKNSTGTRIETKNEIRNTENLRQEATTHPRENIQQYVIQQGPGKSSIERTSRIAYSSTAMPQSVWHPTTTSSHS
ncbi:hypothetical protein EVAR_33075_1 [Eumeta japonica]|uniref:Uncharacterized protein n=1 Tax=Eumeta variegata TaxID=151549 RepID=A0A4C1WSY7_EUMVA|nr:hypothetical protein EVAR_33075_1 [Eumeta japonica]